MHMFLRFINFILNLPVKPIQANNLPDGATLLLLLGWLYLVTVSFLLLFLLGITSIRNLPLLIARLIAGWRGKDKTPNYAFLHMIFPADTTKSAYATEQLHNLLKVQARNRTFIDTFAGRKQLYSPEIVGTGEGGIRFILVVPCSEAEQISHNLISFLPSLKIQPVTDYLETIEGSQASVVELCLGSDFVLPLKEHKALTEHDPMAFITGHMTKLVPGDLIAVQCVTTPVLRSTHFRVLQHVREIQGTIANGKPLGHTLNRRVPRIVSFSLLLPFWIAVFILKAGLAMIAAFVNHDSSPLSFGGDVSQRRSDNPYEQELAESLKTKLDQDLFEVSLRILVVSNSTATIAARTKAITAAYGMFASPYQSIVVRSLLPLRKGKQAETRMRRFRKRLLSPNWLSYGSIVSGSELSDLYHFPNTDLTKTEGLVKSRSKSLPTPLSLKGDATQFDVIVGTNDFAGDHTPIGVTLTQRRRHMYVIGKTGTGKTTLLKNAIYQDMENGKGLAMFDPHGDLFRELLAIVPEHRRKDIIVFDPSDRAYPLGLNILDPGIAFSNDDERQEWITSAVIGVFKKLADEGQWGPRMEHILRSTTLTALQLPNPTLYTIQRLLTEKSYQREVAATLKDPILKQFWAKEFKLLGTMQLANATAPLTHRLGHFITTKLSRHILLQEHSTLRIADIMNEGKILLVNLGKGDIGEDQSAFFGTLLTSLIWIAAYQRVKLPEAKRQDFFVYIDEFQAFATPRFSEIVSEGRKFHLSLILSHQNIAQIEDKSIVKIVAGNAATMVCLKASPEDEAFILPFMKPEVETGDIVNLAPYHFYMKTTHDESEAAFSGMTELLPVEGSEGTVEAVIADSRAQYGVAVEKVEKQLKKLLAPKPRRRGKQMDTKSSKDVELKSSDDRNTAAGLSNG
jgi:hypothetical protein